MKLDVVVPTYNRSALLRRTIASLVEAPIPAGMEVAIWIADNNSKDDTEQMVRALQAQTGRPLSYLKEMNQGVAHTRNTGIRAGSGELVGFVDDDEEVDKNWYRVIAREFADPAIQFIGGPYFPNWAAPVPKWLPPGYHGVIGASPTRARSDFGTDFPGLLQSGNSVIRRNVFDRVGLYSTKLGRSGKGLLSCEDADLYNRMLSTGLRGIYVPDLIIYHHIPGDRLTRRYHRRWCFWNGVSHGVIDRDSKAPHRYILGIPRHRIGRALRGMLSLPRHIAARSFGPAFADELATWELFGFIYGRHFMRVDKYYGQQP